MANYLYIWRSVNGFCKVQLHPGRLEKPGPPLIPAIPCDPAIPANRRDSKTDLCKPNLVFYGFIREHPGTVYGNNGTSDGARIPGGFASAEDFQTLGGELVACVQFLDNTKGYIDTAGNRKTGDAWKWPKQPQT